MVVPITSFYTNLGLPYYLTWMAFGHVIGVYSSSIIAGVVIHMITAISIGVAVGVFLYKTSILNISKLSNGLLYGPIIFSATFIDICTLINKDMANKSSRNSLTIRSKVTLNRILEIKSMRIEINEKGTIT